MILDSGIVVDKCLQYVCVMYGIVCVYIHMNNVFCPTLSF